LAGGGRFAPLPPVNYATDKVLFKHEQPQALERFVPRGAKLSGRGPTRQNSEKSSKMIVNLWVFILAETNENTPKKNKIVNYRGPRLYVWLASGAGLPPS